MHKCNFEKGFLTECGCNLEVCSACGVLHSVSKCSLHQPERHYPQDYYLHELRGIYNSIPQHRKMCIELETALAKMDVSIPTGRVDQDYALDIGGGIGVYAPFFMKRGYRYELNEACRWAGKYALGAYDCPIHACTFEDFPDKYQWAIVNASHILEHLVGAPEMLEKMFRIVRPGGRLIVVVPDQTDLCNPDHLWFFSDAVIRRWFEEVGFVDVRVSVEQIIALEKFIYVTGVKNA